MNEAGDFNNTMFAAKPSIGAKRTIAAKKKGFFSDSDDDEDFAPPPKKPVAQDIYVQESFGANNQTN